MGYGEGILVKILRGADRERQTERQKMGRERNRQTEAESLYKRKRLRKNTEYKNVSDDVSCKKREREKRKKGREE